MDLDIPFGRTRGRSASPVSAEIVRELTEVDLALLDLDRGVKAPTLKRLRDSHHSIARLMAQGLRNTDISAVTGYSMSRLSILKADPAFQELMAHYASAVEDTKDTVFKDAQTKIASLRNDLIEEYHDRLLDEPEKFNIEDLESGIKMTADRTGMGPQSKTTSINVNIDLAARVQAGRARASQIGATPALLLAESAPMKVVEGTVVTPGQASTEPSTPT